MKIVLLSILLLFSSLFADEITCITDKLQNEFIKLYPQATVNAITVIQKKRKKFEFPATYDVIVKARDLRRDIGTFYITEDGKKKHFFKFEIDATLPVVIAKELIPRKSIIDAFNTKIKDVKFNKHSAKAISSLPKTKIMAKKNISTNHVIQKRDVLLAYIIKKESTVNITLKDGTLQIEFSATATKNARINEVITFIKNDGKKIKAKVVSENRAIML
ncbi:MAG: flagellar basal body P-ring formation chaperone FlgA [Campylobacterota bacterium]|nr:flagellar basal body P-ring formation chaperone FlgA [Campylobacterota bacterium]